VSADANTDIRYAGNMAAGGVGKPAATRLTFSRRLGTMRGVMRIKMSNRPFQHSSSVSGSRGFSAIALLVTVACIAFFFAFPRLLVRTLGEDSPWVSYFYLYGNGLVVFLIGIGVILRSGACKLGRGWDTWWFLVLLAGYLFFAAMHAAWILAALRIPFRGGA
jgi:hypothetical protein